MFSIAKKYWETTELCLTKMASLVSFAEERELLGKSKEADWGGVGGREKEWKKQKET